ncbi:MAG TPA: MerR family DNA-binding protein [Candidatus Babeliales bacterium]|nr:MerR family DNA-binding protein [Candidatus Babeliales bacterium]
MALTIGQLAKAAGVALTTVRFYERCNLIPEPERSESGYRHYSPDMVMRIRFIKNAQELGFTLEEIRDLLVLQGNQSTKCSIVKSKAANKIKIVESKIKALKKMKKALQQLHNQCLGRGSITQGCAILEALGSEKITKELLHHQTRNHLKE